MGPRTESTKARRFISSALSAPLRVIFTCLMGYFHAEAQRARRIYIISLWPPWAPGEIFRDGLTQRRRGLLAGNGASHGEHNGTEIYILSVLCASACDFHLPDEIFSRRGAEDAENLYYFSVASVGSGRDFSRWAHAEAQRSAWREMEPRTESTKARRFISSALSAPLREIFTCLMGYFHAEAQRARRIYIISLWPPWAPGEIFRDGLTQRRRGRREFIHFSASSV